MNRHSRHAKLIIYHRSKLCASAAASNVLVGGSRFNIFMTLEGFGLRAI
jgi:hypothetical protein